MTLLTNTHPFFIGFDKTLANIQEAHERFIKTATSNYPPYNVTKTADDKYQIEVAVAGFGKQDIEIELEDTVLRVSGKVTTPEPALEYFHKGIADRPFTRTFTLADNVVVRGAGLFNGLLKIYLDALIPEHKKPRKIDVEDLPEGSPKPFKQFLVE